MPVTELGHIVLYVRDIEAASAFYGEVLGWPLVASAQLNGTEVRAFSTGRTHHELALFEVGPDAAPLPTGPRLGMYHFGVKVGDSDDELRTLHARIRQRDVTVVGSADHGITHSLYVLDPDGNEVELYVDVPGVDWRNLPTMVAPGLPLSL